VQYGLSAYCTLRSSSPSNGWTHDHAPRVRPQGPPTLGKPYHFKASSPPNVYLLNGVKIERDADYGELVAIDYLPDLFMAITFSLVRKPDRLTGAEMRFMRKRMGAKQADLAKELWH